MTESSHPAGEKTAATAPPVVPDHELIRIIGGGSGGEVWLARNVLGMCRAVKVVRAQRSSIAVPLIASLTAC
jgi:hypothetical protein